MSTDSTLQAAFAPEGKLRASLNLGNAVLAHSKTATERPAGVSIDLARAFAAELGVAGEFLQFDTAAKSVEALTREQADIGFMAIDPARAEGIHFTAAYVQIEGAYLVPDGSLLRVNEEVDKPGTRVMVGKGSAYALYLARNLKHATLVEVPTSEEVVDAMLEQKVDVAAGVKQMLEADAQRLPGVRLLPDRFMVIHQAMAMPRGRGAQAEAFLDGFVERMKAGGFVAQALARHGIEGAKVAPARDAAG